MEAGCLVAGKKGLCLALAPHNQGSGQPIAHQEKIIYQTAHFHRCEQKYDFQGKTPMIKNIKLPLPEFCRDEITDDIINMAVMFIDYSKILEFF